MRRHATLSTLTLLGVMSALLAGCPIWGPDNSGPDGSANTHCATNDQCNGSQYCNASTGDCVTSNTCSTTADCHAGYFCDSRGVCEPGCHSTSDCSYGTGLTCNVSTGQCVQGNQCTMDSQCQTGSSCVDGSCRPTTSVCQFDYQCNGGQECVNGACVLTCNAHSDGGASTCPAPEVCTVVSSGESVCQFPTPTGGGCATTGCAAGQVCANNLCSTACTMDSQCPTGDYCNNGVCSIDDRRPPPFCTPPSTGCATGSVCVDGVCRISCPLGPGSAGDNQCLTRDVNFSTCDAMMICRDSHETNPQCARNSECSSGQLCIDAACVTP